MKSIILAISLFFSLTTAYAANCKYIDDTNAGKYEEDMKQIYKIIQHGSNRYALTRGFCRGSSLGNCAREKQCHCLQWKTCFSTARMKMSSTFITKKKAISLCDRARELKKKTADLGCLEKISGKTRRQSSYFCPRLECGGMMGDLPSNYLVEAKLSTQDELKDPVTGQRTVAPTRKKVLIPWKKIKNPLYVK